MHRRFRTTTEAAAILTERTGREHTTHTVRDLCRRDRIVYRANGSYYLVHDTAIDAYIQSLAEHPEPLPLRSLLAEFPPGTTLASLARRARRGEIPAVKDDSGRRWVMPVDAWERFKLAGVA